MTEIEKKAEIFATTGYNKNLMNKDDVTILKCGRYDGYISGAESREPEIQKLQKENTILRKALRMYIDWADECGIAWDNFPDMYEKWYKIVEEKGLGWVDGLMYMAIEEAKEQISKE